MTHVSEHIKANRTDTPPSAEMLRMISGFWVSRALYVAARLGIADLVKDRPRTATELADVTGTHGPSLYRVLRALAGVGVFAEDDSARFALTPLAATLQTGVDGSLRAFALAQLGDEHHSAWGAVLHSVRTGETAFNSIFGIDVWEYRRRNREDAKTFDEAMADFTALVEEAIRESYDFSPFDRVIDVGGGDASLLVTLLKAHPDMRGVLFDLPHVIDRARVRLEQEGLTGRCEIAEGDFFDEVPTGGDAYILKWIIHDWDDERSVSILKNCRRAMPKKSRLLLIEAVIPPGNEPSFHKFMDLNMLVMTGGRERSAAEYRVLLDAAGFSLSSISPTSTEMSVIEGLPLGAPSPV